jgi:hypothetical protein
MSSGVDRQYICKCGDDSFTSEEELNKHIKEMSDARDWRTHGVKE